MLKIYRVLLFSVILGNITAINAINGAKKDVLFLCHYSCPEEYNFFNNNKNNNGEQNYTITEVSKPVTSSDWFDGSTYWLDTWLNFSQYKKEAIQSIQQNKENKIIFYAARLTTQVLHFAAEHIDRIDAILLIDPTYDPKFPISSITNKFPKEMPIVICSTEKEYEKDANLLHTFFASEKKRLIQSGNTQTSKTYGKNLSIISQTSVNLLENLDLDKVTDSDISVIKTLLNNKTIDSLLQFEWKQTLSSQNMRYMIQIKQEENNRYFLNCGLIILASGSLLLYLFYKIGALNMILGR